MVKLPKNCKVRLSPTQRRTHGTTFPLDALLNTAYVYYMRLTQFMRLYGLTEKEMADLAGVSQPTINRLRNGVGGWSSGLLLKVSKATNGEVSVADLVANFAPPETPRPRGRPKKPPVKRGRKPAVKAPTKKRPAKKTAAKKTRARR